MSAIALDPLIAEAKRRMRRRRVVLVFVLIAGSAIAAYGLGPGGWLGSAQTGHSASSGHSLARLVVPIDSTERRWRSSVRGLGGPVTASAEALQLRRRALSIIGETGAIPIRIKIWRRTSPAAVELVAATRMNPAAYLRHRAVKFVDAFRWPVYVKIVNGRGSYIFEWGGAANGGFVGAPPALENCSPVMNWGGFHYPPCPSR